MTPPRKPITGQYEADNNHLPNWSPVADSGFSSARHFMRELASLKEIMLTRMDGYEDAIKLLQAFADRQPTIAEVVAKFEEKFHGIDTQFKERDQRVEQTAKESKVAVDAAFSAQKEAVSEQNKYGAAAIAKSEAATMKQIDQIILLLTSSVKTLDDKINGSIKTVDDKINDTKERVNGIEQRGAGASNMVGFIGTAAMIVGTIIGAVVAVFFRGGV